MTVWRKSAAAGRNKFPSFIASLPMNDVPAALEEMDRAITQLGARGIQIGTNILGRPLDDPEFFPVFERITRHHRLGVWMHPVRQQGFADYRSEAEIHVRNLAGAGLALRDQRRDGAHRLFRPVRPAAGVCASSPIIAAA